MGHILQTTPTMGHFSIEVKRESFYIQSDKPRSIFMYPGNNDTGTVEFCIDDIPKIRACLDEVEKYLKR